MRIVLRDAESFFQVFNRLMDVSGSHTNFEDLFHNIARKYHKLIQQLPPWSWKCSCGNASILSQKRNKKCFHPYKNQIHPEAWKLWRVFSVRYVPRQTTGIYRRYDRYRTLRTVGHQYLYQTRWNVRHDIDTDTPLRPVQPFVLVSDISVRSVQHQSRYEILRQIRYIIQYLYWTCLLYTSPSPRD